MKKKTEQELESEIQHNIDEQMENFNLDEDCNCKECECEKDEPCEKHCDCHHQDEEAGQYLAMAQRLQADFENYRKRVAEQLDRERQEGIKSVIEVFLPCLDTFKEAKKSITDDGIMNGINMIENKILEALKSVHVEKIEAVGNTFDPHLHNVIAVMQNPEKENDIVLEEYQSGWTLNGKVIRYSKVIVNKLS